MFGKPLIKKKSLEIYILRERTCDQMKKRHWPREINSIKRQEVKRVSILEGTRSKSVYYL